MNVRLGNLLVCPECRAKLRLQPGWIPGLDLSRVVSGYLVCDQCNTSYPTVNGIPRFVSSENYASSFGFQWTMQAQTQLDKFNGTTISRDRFFGETGWPSQLYGQTILEVGSGAGRFTQIALETGADVYSLDYTQAVDVNLANKLRWDRNRCCWNQTKCIRIKRL